MRRLPGPTGFFFRPQRAQLRLPDGRAVRIVGVHPFPPERGHLIPPVTIDHVLADRRLGIAE